MKDRKIDSDIVMAALDKAYKEAGNNAYFGNGFKAGIQYAFDYYKNQDSEYSTCPNCSNEYMHKNDCFCENCIGDYLYKSDLFTLEIEGKDCLRLYMIDVDYTIIDVDNYYNFVDYVMFDKPTDQVLHELLVIYHIAGKLFETN